ncbi:prephenate dehydratase [bacterium]|nr:prephenate dehydratase [bacterium]
MQKLAGYRKKIDSIDAEILNLLSNRGKVAEEIGKIKKKTGGPIHVPSREKLIYERLANLNRGPYKNQSLISIFREIISATRSLEEPLKVSYLGPLGTFTQMAAEKYFGSSTELLPEGSIKSVFQAVERGHTHYGVVPIENSTEGLVSQSLDLLVESPLHIQAEIILRISHHLMSAQALDLKQIKTVYSHPQALAQCRSWLLKNVPQAKLKETESTAAAARHALNEKNSAAIASEIAANHYKLSIIRKNIQDLVQNYTRFLVVGEDVSNTATKSDKTSIVFTIQDEVGGLYKILSPLASGKINLTKIESRPLKRKAWEYLFSVDLDGHADEPKIKKALAAIKKRCSFFKVLGSYPVGQVY